MVDYTKAFYTPHEVAELARVHPSTILNYVASGRLYAIRLSARTIRIPVRSVVALLEPERLAPSSHEPQPDADLEADLADSEAREEAAPAITTA
jgi:excisionase family DNA binding protein